MKTKLKKSDTKNSSNLPLQSRREKKFIKNRKALTVYLTFLYISIITNALVLQSGGNKVVASFFEDIDTLHLLTPVLQFILFSSCIIFLLAVVQYNHLSRKSLSQLSMRIEMDKYKNIDVAIFKAFTYALVSSLAITIFAPENPSPSRYETSHIIGNIQRNILSDASFIAGEIQAGNAEGLEERYQKSQFAANTYQYKLSIQNLNEINETHFDESGYLMKNIVPFKDSKTDITYYRYVANPISTGEIIYRNNDPEITNGVVTGMVSIATNSRYSTGCFTILAKVLLKNNSTHEISEKLQYEKYSCAEGPVFTPFAISERIPDGYTLENIEFTFSDIQFNKANVEKKEVVPNLIFTSPNFKFISDKKLTPAMKFCIEGWHINNPGATWKYESSYGSVIQGKCYENS